MQVHHALQMLLQIIRRHARERDAVIMPKLDHGVAMRVADDRRRQLLHRLHVGEVIELDRVLLRVEVDDGVGADAGVEDEIIVAGPADGDGDDGLTELVAGGS